MWHPHGGQTQTGKKGLEEEGAEALSLFLQACPRLLISQMPSYSSLHPIFPSPTEPGKVLFALCSVPRATGQAAGVCVLNKAISGAEWLEMSFV